MLNSDQTRKIQLTILLCIKINAENVDSEIAFEGTTSLKGSTKQELLLNDRKNILVKGTLQPFLNKLKDGKVIFCKYSTTEFNFKFWVRWHIVLTAKSSHITRREV